jgi:TetR/AcrR family tetracycline transcriptional repressor
MPSVAKRGDGLDRDAIVTTALGLLDDVGLDGLTLRRLAQELGVQAPALYWHVRNKRELLDLMAARIMFDNVQMTELGPGQTWSDLLRANAHGQRRALLAHRDGARLVAGARPLEELLPLLEQILSPLVEAGFTPGQAMRANMTLSLFVGGFVLEEQAERARWAEQALTDDDRAEFLRLVSRPGLETVITAFAESGDPNGEDAFREGVQLIIDGLAQVLVRNSAPAIS